jgi:hypothetical protein
VTARSRLGTQLELAVLRENGMACINYSWIYLGWHAPSSDKKKTHTLTRHSYVSNKELNRKFLSLSFILIKMPTRKILFLSCFFSNESNFISTIKTCVRFDSKVQFFYIKTIVWMFFFIASGFNSRGDKRSKDKGLQNNRKYMHEYPMIPITAKWSLIHGESFNVFTRY